MSGEPEEQVAGEAAAVGAEDSPVQLDVSLCKACGICIELCPTHVFDATELGEAIVARPEDCNRCLLCELHCPDFAIEVRRKEKKAAAAAGAESETAATDEADEAADEHTGRVFAALASSKSERSAEVTGDQHCATDHEEH